MSDFIALVFLAVVFIALSFAVLRSFLRVWLDHRFRSALLRNYESSPGSFGSFEDVERAIREGEEGDSRGRPQDFRLTGGVLAVLGLGGLALGRALELGTTAVGVYIAGAICFVLGIMIALLGLVIRSLSKSGIGTEGQPTS